MMRNSQLNVRCLFAFLSLLSLYWTYRCCLFLDVQDFPRGNEWLYVTCQVDCMLCCGIQKLKKILEKKTGSEEEENIHRNLAWIVSACLSVRSADVEIIAVALLASMLR